MTDIPMTGSVPITESSNQTPETPSGNSFSFHASRSTYFKMLFKFMLLQLITLGIYRFWAKTHVRRYLWSSTELLGDRFEYLGTATELFIGFLIAIAFLVPLGIVSHFAEILFGADSIGFAVYNFAYLAVLLFLINFAVFRLWRYRLTRTSWRGMRFTMKQGALKYAGIAMLWTVATILTIGIAYPWMQAYLTRYKIDRVTFGDGKFWCEVKGLQLALFYLAVFACVIVMYGSFGLSIFAAVQIKEAGGSDFAAYTSSALLIFSAVASIVSILVVPIIGGWVQVKLMNKVINETSLDRCQFSSRLQFRKLIPAILLFAVLLIASFAIIGGVISSVAFESLLSGAKDGESPLLAFTPFIMIAFLILIIPVVGILYNITIGFSAMREFFQNMQITNPRELEKIISDGKDIPTHGEGFADAFDVGAF